MILVVAAVLVTSVGCFGKKKEKHTADMAGSLTADATYARGMELLAAGKLRDAESVLKRIQFTPELREDIEPLARVALADATFHRGGDLELIDARNLYMDFVTLNLDHPLAPYAQLQVGICSLAQVNHPTKDQYQTLEAIEDLREVERRWPDSAFVGASRAYLRAARANLAESEYLVGRFYLNRKSYPAALQRFNHVVEFYPDYPDMESVLYYLGRAYLRSGNEVEGRIYLDKLVTEYPEGDHYRQARKALDSVGGDLGTDVKPLSE